VRAQENAAGSVFRVDAGGKRAKRVKVDFGRASATTIEIRRGLAPGDRVIVSDDSAYDRNEEIRIQ
jgi:multidrug efflux pump subunit AcrA (membrane-fusion protein)